MSHYLSTGFGATTTAVGDDELVLSGTQLTGGSIMIPLEDGRRVKKTVRVSDVFTLRDDIVCDVIEWVLVSFAERRREAPVAFPGSMVTPWPKIRLNPMQRCWRSGSIIR